jgi:hypothetical protein
VILFAVSLFQISCGSYRNAGKIARIGVLPASQRGQISNERLTPLLR